MSHSERILVVDSEELFLRSAKEVFVGEGYECDVAPNADAARSKLNGHRYHLVVSDIESSGNSTLEFIREISRNWRELPIILVTARPTLNTAVQAIELPVVAYLIKPLEMADLCRHAHAAIARARIGRVLENARERAREWPFHFDPCADALPFGWRETDQIGGFVSLAMANIHAGVSSLAHLTQTLAESTGMAGASPCRLLDCPKTRMQEALLRDTIEALERTRTAFKSKELGELRRKIGRALKSGADDETVARESPPAPGPHTVA